MIIVKLHGGMGNQMFQYALGRALSAKYNVPFKLDVESFKVEYFHVKRNYDLSIFNIIENIISNKDIPLRYRTWYQNKFIFKLTEIVKRIFNAKGHERFFHFDSKILDIGPDAYLNGYWQSPKYFNEISDVIRKEFTFKNEFPFNIKNLMEIIKKENSLCIHFRRGDYVGNSFHEVVNNEYYYRCIDKMKTLTNIDKIYVFSDDIKWCEENIKFDLPVMFVGDEYSGERAEGHMALMSSCKNFIIPNSSFAWWSAWLSDSKDKKVIVPQYWFTDKTINSDDLIPKEWIRL